MHHLTWHPDGYELAQHYPAADPRLLMPAAIPAVDAAMRYVMTLFPWDAPETTRLV